jgi:hypothetical protein
VLARYFCGSTFYWEKRGHVSVFQPHEWVINATEGYFDWGKGRNIIYHVTHENGLLLNDVFGF